MIGDTTCVPIRIRTGEILQPIQITPDRPRRRVLQPGRRLHLSRRGRADRPVERRGHARLGTVRPGQRRPGAIDPRDARADDHRDARRPHPDGASRKQRPQSRSCRATAGMPFERSRPELVAGPSRGPTPTARLSSPRVRAANCCGTAAAASAGSATSARRTRAATPPATRWSSARWTPNRCCCGRNRCW